MYFIAYRPVEIIVTDRRIIKSVLPSDFQSSYFFIKLLYLYYYSISKRLYNFITTLMVSLISISKAQRKLSENIRDRRLFMELTQEGLAERSGVPLATLRKFEQKGIISLESFLKLLMVVGGLEDVIHILKPSKPNFTSIDDVLKDTHTLSRKRGHKK